MKELLPLLPKPANYAGLEAGIRIKEPASVNLRVALAFPDTYEVGMSYLGQKILYNIINERPHWQAERVMAPEREAVRIMREKNVQLATLETDTPLLKMDVVGFSVTHELCFTDVLHMLDLANIPLRSKDRGTTLVDYPLIIAGGGAMLGAEPLVPFIDLVCLGEGEEMLPEVLELLEQALAENWSRAQFLTAAARIGGVYIPSFFEVDQNGQLKALVPWHRPVRRIVADLNMAKYPTTQILPTGAVHNRLSLEIARGCPRGCRFCHAGMVYRPLRERAIGNLQNLLNKCLDDTGFEEMSFLALSAGDFSGLNTLYNSVYDRCAKEQIGLSLPSLRVGSINDDIMEKMATVRRTGITLAPEAGSQRLRNVINKGIDEENLLAHAQKLLKYGWRQVKLYFMIGLPTETDEDLEAIALLCRKIRDVGGKGSPRLQVTCALSPFVPKPFTPFQWEAQPDRDEIERKLNVIRGLLHGQKGITLRWHNPDVSHLEGILSRGDRRLADVVENAYRKGAVFCSWTESFNLQPWLEALKECNLEAKDYICARNTDAKLPWSHLEAGVSEEFLLRERKKAMSERITPPCSPTFCGQCGACDTTSSPSRLGAGDIIPREKYNLRFNFASRDQDAWKLSQPVQRETATQNLLKQQLAAKAVRYRLWHIKSGLHAYLSQLELQALLWRAMRRARLPLAFSQGFHPMPLLSFGRALPVGAQSLAEWFAVTLHTFMPRQEVLERLNLYLAENLRACLVEPADKAMCARQSIAEEFTLKFNGDKDLMQAAQCFADFSALDVCERVFEGKKGPKKVDLRPMLGKWTIHSEKDKTTLAFCTDWTSGYISPLRLVSAILSGMEQTNWSQLMLIKTAQIFENGSKYRFNIGNCP